ncbi:MAG: PAS domain-containing protein [Rhodospirillales bacterium]|nr:PAS domain-containing protein [Rhodospirillales bacterium]MBT3905634.1 PAS domain-containing protein [Rhodospirillaceae bacterium]MBT5034945.1 PAS domain-containing protein [Rhodospirillaceae bacterium]MBT6219607.1 PAS domain-containing protein [Rhodospirillaceae bacterium]MBT6363214.1 PAS domain-containing protein [Rhodospirillaceae bacterium]
MTNKDQASAQFSNSLMSIVRGGSLYQGDTDKAFNDVTETATQTLNIARAGVWLYADDCSKIVCEDLYEKADDVHSKGGELAAVDYPDYFAAIEKDRTIDAHDAHTDPRTREFSESYLTPLGIASMLDVPIRFGGQLIGVICLEHIGSARPWSSDEITYAGSLGDLLSHAIEVRERILAEEALRKNEALFRAVVNHSPTKIHIKDIDGRYILINNEAADLFGVTDEDGRGKDSYDLFSKEAADIFSAHDQKVIDSGEALEEEEEFIRKDGLHTYLTTKFPIYDQGVMTGIGAIGTDITERKRAEVARQESDNRFQTVVDSSPAAITLKDRNGVFLLVNQTYAKWANSTSTKIIGRKVHDLFSKEQADIIEALDQNIMASGEDHARETVITYGDGQTRNILTQKRPIYSADGNVASISTIITDITEQKQAEIALQESESRFLSIFNSSPTAITLRDQDSRFIMVNQTFADWMQSTPSELVGKTIFDLFPPDQAEDIWAIDQNVWKTGENHTGEVVRLFEDGMDHTIIDNKRPIYSADGDIIAISTVVTDITELKQVQAELQSTNDELEARIAERTAHLEAEISERKRTEKALLTAKLEAETSSKIKTDFLANMSHELRTPLNAIIGFGQFLKVLPDDKLSERQDEYVDDILGSGRHLLRLINDVLDISAIEAGKLEIHIEDVEIAPIIHEAVRLVQARADAGKVQISVEDDKNKSKFGVDELRLKQILLNLLSNAIKFTPEGGKVSLNCTLNDELKIIISDTGVGMTKEEIRQALELFGQVDSSLERKYEGTGLGLPLAKQLIEAHGGTLDIESETNVGTVITIVFSA